MKQIISKKQLREFGLLIGFGFPLLIGWLIPTITGHSFRIWTLWIGMSGLILGLLAPYLLLFPYKGWMKIGYALGWVNSYIILGLVFIIVLILDLLLDLLLVFILFDIYYYLEKNLI